VAGPGKVENLKPFQKGNPGGPGRPKMTTEQREAKKMAKELAGEAMDILTKWMRSDNPAAAVKAAEAIIDRAEGKATQEIKQTGNVSYVAAVPERIENIDQWLKQAAQITQSPKPPVQ
jgi:hypothetical protein